MKKSKHKSNIFDANEKETDPNAPPSDAKTKKEKNLPPPLFPPYPNIPMRPHFEEQQLLLIRKALEFRKRAKNGPYRIESRVDGPEGTRYDLEVIMNPTPNPTSNTTPLTPAKLFKASFEYFPEELINAKTKKNKLVKKKIPSQKLELEHESENEENEEPSSSSEISDESSNSYSYQDFSDDDQDMDDKDDGPSEAIM